MQKHYDKVPTQGSTNPVKSDGLHQQLATIGSKIGDLTELETEDKTDLVSAINEVKQATEGISSSAADTTYVDNQGLGSDNVQGALDEVVENLTKKVYIDIFSATPTLKTLTTFEDIIVAGNKYLITITNVTGDNSLVSVSIGDDSTSTEKSSLHSTLVTEGMKVEYVPKINASHWRYYVQNYKCTITIERVEKVMMKELVRTIGTVYNVSEAHEGTSYTLSSAIAQTVADKMNTAGMTIKFLSSESGEFEEYRNTSTEWTDVGRFWEKAGAVNTPVEVSGNFSNRCWLNALSTDETFGETIDVANNNYGVSDFLDVSGYKSVHFWYISGTGNPDNVGHGGWVFYDENYLPIIGTVSIVLRSAATDETTINIPSGAKYFRYTMWQNNSAKLIATFYADMQFVTPEDINTLDNNIKSIEQVLPDYSEAEILVNYGGEKIPAPNELNRIGFTRVMNSGYSAQGSAVYGGYWFGFRNHHSTVEIVDLVNKVKHSSITLPSVTNDHCNNVCFSNIFYDENDTFPLVYTSGSESGDYNHAQAWRIQLIDNVFTVEQVQEIIFPTGTSSNHWRWSQIYFDNELGYMWVSTNSKSSAVFYKMAIPAIFDSENNVISSVELTDADVIDSFTTEKNRNQQGGVIKNGILYLMDGVPTRNTPTRMYVYNVWGKRLINVLDIWNLTELHAESEGLGYWDGKLVLAFATGIYYIYL